MKGTRIDKSLFFLIGALLAFGGLLFTSAIFGLLARGASNMSSVVFNHVVLGIGIGGIALLIGSRTDYRVWRKFAPHIFIITLALTAAVFIPQLGVEHGGGRRWLDIAGLSVQPAEYMKVATIIIAAAYFSTIRNRIGSLRWALGGLLLILLGPAILLFAQPDLGTLGVIVCSTLAIYFVAGARIRDFLTMALIFIVAIVALAYVRPYVLDRIQVFFDPSHAPQAEGYQIRQSLIAIGSGGFLGRGFGQSVQKFTYLPEPIGDSIFAVLGEEFGFVGSVVLIGFFLALALRGFGVATGARDSFGSLLAIGISTYLVIEAFINIASMLGIAPLTGIPLTFISQGGSAMLASLGSAGILLSISRKSNRS